MYVAGSPLSCTCQTLRPANLDKGANSVQILSYRCSEFLHQGKSVLFHSFQAQRRFCSFPLFSHASGPKLNSGCGGEAASGVSSAGRSNPEDLAVAFLCGGHLVFLGPARPASAMGSRLHRPCLGPGFLAMAELRVRLPLLGTLRPASLPSRICPGLGYTAGPDLLSRAR